MASTASNIIDQSKLNSIVEFKDIAAYDIVSPVIISTGSATDGTPASAITPATQRIGEPVDRIAVAPRIHEDFGIGGTRIGQVTVFGEYSDTRNIDHLRQGKNVADLKHFVKGTLPFISVNTGKVLCENDGRVKHQMTSGISYGQSSLYQVYDDIKRRIIPFEDFPGKLDPAAFVGAGDYIMQYMIVTDLTRDVDKFINPDTMDGVIEVFEIRNQFANTNFSDIQINGIRCDLSTGDWNFDQKGSSLVDTKFEKRQSTYDYFEDAQDTLFSGHVYNVSGSFASKQGYPTGSAAYFAHDDERFIHTRSDNSGTDRYFALPGFISEGRYGISPFDESESHIASSYEHVKYALKEEVPLSVKYDLTKDFDYVYAAGSAHTYRDSALLVALWHFDNNLMTSDDPNFDPSAVVLQKASLSSGPNLVVSGGHVSYTSKPPKIFSLGEKPSIHFPGNGTILFGPEINLPGTVPTYSSDNGYPTVLTGSADFGRYSFGDGTSDNAFTMSLWVRWNNIKPTGGSYVSTIIAKSEYDENREWELRADNTRLEFIMWDDSGAAGVQDIADALKSTVTFALIDPASSIKAFTNNRWYHIVITYDGTGSASNGDTSSVRFYIDGTRVVEDGGGANVTQARGANYVAMENTSARVSVGNFSRGSFLSTGQFWGNIAEIAIWRNHVMGAGTVKALYSAGNSNTKYPADTQTTKALNNVLTSSFFDISDIGSRFTSCNTGFIFPKNIVPASNVSGINNHLGVDSIAFGGLLK